MRRLLAPSSLLFLLACGGPRQPGPHAGEQVVWRVDSVETSFENCTDDPSLREKIGSFSLGEGAYLAYEVDKDAKTARTMLCRTYDADTCEIDPDGVTLDIVDKKLVFSHSVSSPFTDWACTLELSATWNITDHGETMSFDAVFLNSLVDGVECPALQEEFVKQSQNGSGLDGCAVKLALKGTLPE